MPQALSIASVIEANRLSSDIPWLCMIDLQIIDPATRAPVVTKHFVRNPEDVTFNGQVYEKSAFDIQIKNDVGRLAEVQLTVNDYTQTVQALMEEYGGGVGSNVTFYLVNGSLLDQPAEIVEFFQIVGASASDYIQSFTLGAEDALTQTFPRRRQTRDFCQWRYKSTQCGYVGALPSCDLSLQGPNGCATHVNTINFGGFPGLNTNGFRYA